MNNEIQGNNMGQPVAPMVSNPTPVVGEQTVQAGENKGGKSPVTAIVIVLLLLVGVGVGVFLATTKNKEKENTVVEQPVQNTQAQEEFLALANKYVTAVSGLWNDDAMVCQDAVKKEETLKPSALASKDSFEGDAFYYVFINTKDSNEMKLNVDDTRAVAGWIRIGKADNSYYVALSDGTNYIVDKGTEFGVKSTDLTINDVVTTGSGSNYQYMDGEIFGSNTDGNGWGIGDYAISTDGDDTNDGLYMSNGKKDSGWTPFCSNVEE